MDVSGGVLGYYYLDHIIAGENLCTCAKHPLPYLVLGLFLVISTTKYIGGE